MGKLQLVLTSYSLISLLDRLYGYFVCHVKSNGRAVTANIENALSQIALPPRRGKGGRHWCCAKPTLLQESRVRPKCPCQGAYTAALPLDLMYIKKAKAWLLASILISATLITWRLGDSRCTSSSRIRCWR